MERGRERERERKAWKLAWRSSLDPTSSSPLEEASLSIAPSEFNSLPCFSIQMQQEGMRGGRTTRCCSTREALYFSWRSRWRRLTRPSEPNTVLLRLLPISSEDSRGPFLLPGLRNFVTREMGGRSGDLSCRKLPVVPIMTILKKFTSSFTNVVSGITVKLAVVSNFDIRLRKLLKDLNIVDLFDAVIVSSEVGYEKPDPGIFKSALDQLQVEPNRAVHIGDDEKADKYGAAVVGIECWLWGRDVKTFSDILKRILIHV
ncbi:uncharacterized protein LOC115755449 isoform X2 [Rhodamnia argentea]|uniref:Uncharacterized protein LOC115755449 isoform X2 n=1 Tax=Rhodamnia argentea TaxID=178133 RepID=A0ABM3HIF2_9MYRT|nr:uncharacterized protein LOC115755449 isoform X2 [Rhodamnia argentea]